jgi:Predicted transcriptional regulators
MPHTRANTQKNLSITRLGDRVRQLRVAAGLTQTDLAGTRFSKEYVSQIERGKTRPTRETIEWLAQQLNVDADFLQNGVSTDERSRIETFLARAEALTQANKCADAIEQIEDVKTAVLVTASPELEVRLLTVEAWARQDVGDVREAIELLARAGSLAEGQNFSDVDRADILFRLGVCRYKLSSVATRWRCSTRHSSSPSAPAFRAICFGRRSSTGARAAGAASATTKLHARTSNAHSSSLKDSMTGA